MCSFVCFFIAEQKSANKHAEASIRRALLASLCRHGNPAHTTVLRANGSHWPNGGAHFIDLRDSGRWEYYYTLPKFYDALREAFHARDEWARIVGVSPPEGGVSA